MRTIAEGKQAIFKSQKEFGLANSSSFGFDSYSVRKLFTGFPSAARIA
jgi:hypothetical protein